MKNILLIGCGHMGYSLMNAWLKSKKYSVFVVDPNQHSKLEKLKIKKKLKLKIYKKITEINDFSNFDYMVFAVKPLDLKNILYELATTKFKKDSIIISVIAGIKTKLFENSLKFNKQIVRVMPNMPALIGEGMNCIYANKFINLKNKNEIKKLIEFTGKSVIFDKEKYIDMATAVSGSGPGYIFNIIDAMQKAAIKLGFKKNVAEFLVNETFKGSIHLLLQNKLTAEKLVSSVATKGGTTEAGLKVMNHYKMHKIFTKSIKAAHKKATQQGK